MISSEFSSLTGRRKTLKRRLPQSLRAGVRSAALGTRSGARGARLGASIGGRGAGFGGRAAARGARLAARRHARGTLRGSRSAAKGTKLGMRAIATGVKAGAILADMQRPSRPASKAPRMGSAAGGFLSGLTTMYFLDPAAGRQRRLTAAQKARALLAKASDSQRQVRHSEGANAGTVHDIRAERAQPRPPVEHTHAVGAVVEPDAARGVPPQKDARFAS